MLAARGLKRRFSLGERICALSSDQFLLSHSIVINGANGEISRRLERWELVKRLHRRLNVSKTLVFRLNYPVHIGTSVM